MVVFTGVLNINSGLTCNIRVRSNTVLTYPNRTDEFVETSVASIVLSGRGFRDTHSWGMASDIQPIRRFLIRRVGDSNRASDTRTEGAIIRYILNGLFSNLRSLWIPPRVVIIDPRSEIFWSPKSEKCRHYRDGLFGKNRIWYLRGVNRFVSWTVLLRFYVLYVYQ